MRLLAALTAMMVLLGGCSSLLDRDYFYITPHNMTPSAAEGDPSVLRAENYQELVNALIYFISQGTQENAIRLYGDWEDVEAALEAACLEVVQEDPLGAYAVEYIKYSVASVVTYYEADIQITYRRSREQVASIVSATGTTAIRNELESALVNFSTEQVLRIGYFNEDEDYILTLCQEAFCANPATALDMPEIEVAIYPDNGQQRIVEILLSYHLEPQELERRQALLLQTAGALAEALEPASEDETILAIAQTVLDQGGFLPDGGYTAYHALLAGGADSQGLALAQALLCLERNIPCQVVPGSFDGQPHFWTVVSTQSGWRHLDLTRMEEPDGPFFTDDQLLAAGFSWDTASVPRCRSAQAEVETTGAR